MRANIPQYLSSILLNANAREFRFLQLTQLRPQNMSLMHERVTKTDMTAIQDNVIDRCVDLLQTLLEVFDVLFHCLKIIEVLGRNCKHYQLAW